MNKQQLATKIWESANQMRSKIEANEYKDYILGFIFYKYLSDKEVRYLKDTQWSDEDIRLVNEDNPDVVRSIRANLGYFISYDNLFSTWIAKGSDFNISNVRDALGAFNRLIDETYIKVFENIFNTLDTGLSKLGDSAASQTKAVSGLLQLIKDIPMDGKQDYDVLGFVYEYLIGMFAANAGKKAGEFYTPHEVSVLMSEIIANELKDRSEIAIYDPTSGSGSLLINIGRAIAKYIGEDNKIKYYAQELKQNTFNLTRMNLIMRGIIPANLFVRCGDTLEDDWPYFENEKRETYKTLYVDAVVSNPPYSQKWDPSGKENDPRYSRFGLAPKSKADYAFLLHDLFHLKPNGIMTIVLPHGVLFRGGEEGEIRKNLIENNHIDAIIGLPANIFFGTGIPTIIMVLKQKRDRTGVLVIDASKCFAKEGKNNRLRASDIKRISDTVCGRTEEEGFSREVTREQIRENEYNLNIPRYVDSSEAKESWDIYATMFGGIPCSEVDMLSEYWDAFPSLRDCIFDRKDNGYYSVRTGDIRKAVKENGSVREYEDAYRRSFTGFSDFMRDELLKDVLQVNVSKEETVIADNIFDRLSGIGLIDRYDAYEILDGVWCRIAFDLEIIQTEGFEAIRGVDANIVLKKKDGRDVETQNGWRGHVIPFELVQEEMMSDDLRAIREMENRLGEIASEYDEIYENLSEDERDSGVTGEDGSRLDIKSVNAYLKANRNSLDLTEDSFDSKMKRAGDLSAEESELKRSLKKASEDLTMATKTRIEGLTDSEIYSLLDAKWIKPLTDALAAMPDNIVNTLTSRIQALSDKYSVTFSDIENQITDTSAQLADMIDSLTGTDLDMQGLKELQSILRGE